MTQTKGKKSGKVTTPLHLLQTLTRTLNEHLAEACAQAEQDAGKALEKLNRQYAKLEEKLAEAQEKLHSRTRDEAGNKSIGKAQNKVNELQQALTELQQARQAAQAYVRQLQADVRQTLRLAKGLERIDDQVTQAIDKRGDGTVSPAPKRSRSPRKSPASQPAA